MTDIDAVMDRLATAPGVVFDLRGYPSTNHRPAREDGVPDRRRDRIRDAVPDRGPTGAFVDDTGDGKKYADKIETKLTGLIASATTSSEVDDLGVTTCIGTGGGGCAARLACPAPSDGKQTICGQLRIRSPAPGRRRGRYGQ
jgi:hypothetical protein